MRYSVVAISAASHEPMEGNRGYFCVSTSLAARGCDRGRAVFSVRHADPRRGSVGNMPPTRRSRTEYRSSHRDSRGRSHMRSMLAGFIVLAGLGTAAFAAGAEKPNVLFIAVDDLNHWVGYLGRNPQTITPNIDRLAARG